MTLLFFIIFLVLTFLTGFLVAEADWFKPAKASLFAFFHTVALKVGMR